MIYERNGIKIGVYHFPDRKRPMLGIAKGNEIVTVASFSSGANAKYYDDAMEQFLEGLVKEQEHE